MINHFALVGEHKGFPDRLLMLGEDGEYYAWELTDDQIRPIELDDEWNVEPALLDRTLSEPEGAQLEP